MKYPKPGAWHDIGTDPADLKAVDRLKAEGLVEIFEASNQYR